MMNKFSYGLMIAAIPISAIAISLVIAPENLSELGLSESSLADLREPAGRNWLTNGGDWKNSRYSTLDQINRRNVSKLKSAWVMHLGSGLGAKYSLEATPLVEDGIMYVPSGNNEVFAIDAATGALIWEHKSHLDQSITTVCCGWNNRGAAMSEDKIFLGRLDGTLVALDKSNGKMLWQATIGRWEDGYTITSAPLYHDGVVYTGVAGGDREARGKVVALNAETGEENWLFWTAAGPGEIGGDTWPAPDDPDPIRAGAYLQGGSSVWQTPAIDPDLGLVYFSTGNPGPDAGGVGANRPGDNLFSSSIVALHLDGTYAWHFQLVHHDLWDFDCPSPVILFDQMYQGQMRKGIAEACKTGWIYILDRETGEPLIGIDETEVEFDARVASSPTQPIPRGDAIMPQCPQPLGTWITKCIFGVIYDMPILQSPGGNGGPNWAPMAYSPHTGYFYAAAADRPQARMVQGLGGFRPPAIGARYAGTFTAVDSRTNEIAWQKQMPYSIGQGSGALATAGRLIFHGEPDGNFQAYDDATGDLLWQWQTGAGADAPAITYEVDGVQYVAIAVGGVAIQTASANGDMIWAFSLEGTPNDRLQPFEAPEPPVSVVGLAGAIVETNEVQIVDYGYVPARITVPAGTEVIFTNTGAELHNAASASGGGFDTELMSNGQAIGVTYNQPGTYDYTCTPHPFMMGQVIVTGEPVEGAPEIVLNGNAVPSGNLATMRGVAQADHDD